MHLFYLLIFHQLQLEEENEGELVNIALEDIEEVINLELEDIIKLKIPLVKL
jgi:hypothetical protein